jgi:hypothetical protein
MYSLFRDLFIYFLLVLRYYSSSTGTKGGIMLYREMPKTSDKLSILGFGCMRLPVKREPVRGWGK